MDRTSVAADGRVRLDDDELVREWRSLVDLAADYWRCQRLTGRAKEAQDMAASMCVHDLVDEPAWDGALDLIDALLAAAVGDEMCFLAAGPLEELVVSKSQGPVFIAGIEARARGNARWAAAVKGIWLDHDADSDVNRRLSVFGARHATGQTPPDSPDQTGR